MKNLFIVFSFVLCTFFSSLILAQTTTKTGGQGQSISSAYNPKDFKWEISWPGRVSYYDLVYKSPPIDPLQGIALGNGEVAVLFWCEDSKIIAVVNKSDLWDDAPFGPFRNWSAKEEDYSTTQRHACRIIIDFKFPVFNTLYLSDFKARLNLADASLSIEASGPFGNVSLKAFVDHTTGVLFYALNSDLNEDVPVDVVLERFGSRTFSHWYSQINRDASIGLSGTETTADNNSVYITHKLTSGTFAVGGSVIQNNNLTVKYSREHSRRAVIQLTGSRQKSAQLAFSVTSPVAGDGVPELKQTLSSAREKGIEAFRKSHAEIWKSIWNRSFMDYGDDYLNNLWYLTMYYSNASQGGKYPGRFDNGLWGWNRDVQNWNFYFHWNHQQLYWPLNAAGYHELIDPYLEYRFNSLPLAKKDARDLFNSDGAFISDVTDRRGYNSSGEQGNHTPVAEIALDFWRQYQYTGDKKFLKERALPFILEAARFFESLLVKETDGLYHAKEGTGYEGWIKMKDGLTELVYAKVLFTTALEAMKAAGTNLPEAAKWNEIALNVAPLPVVRASEGLIVRADTGFKINSGIFKGNPVSSDEIVSAGWGIKEKKWLITYFDTNDPEYFYFSKDDPAYSAYSNRNGLKLLDGIFPSVPSSPVFPSGLIGLTQRDSRIFNIMAGTTLLYGKGCNLTLDNVPIVMARLGMADGVSRELNGYRIGWNGLANWDLEGDFNQAWKKDADLFFRTKIVRDVASAEKFPFPMWPFRDISTEGLAVAATAINESLLQSYDGILRVFPAFPTNRNGRFTLHAVGGFIVSSEIKAGQVQWISIKSLAGNLCKLEVPWDKSFMQSNLKKNRQVVSGNFVEIRTKPNEVIMILPQWYDLGSWTVVPENPLANENVRNHSSGEATLGIPRMF